MKTTFLLSLLGSILGSVLAVAAPQLLTDSDTLSPESSLRLSFAQAVVEPGQVGSTAPNTLLEITPALDGELHWIAPSVAEFKLLTHPRLGQRYKFSLKKGQQFLDGSAIEPGLLKELAAPEFRHERIRKRGSSRLPTFFIRFNDAVSPLSTNPYLLFKDKDGHTVSAVIRQGRWEDINSLSYVGPTWQQRSEGWTTPKANSFQPDTELPTALLVTPAAPLPVGNDWRLYLSPGLPNAALSAVTSDKHSQWVGSINPTAVDSILAVTQVNEPRHLAISFNKNLPKDLTLEQLREFITIKPEPADLKLIRPKNLRTLQFFGDFNSNAQWTVQVHNGLAAEDGLTLPKPVIEKIVFNNLPPHLAVASADQAQLASGTRQYEIETINLSSVRLRIKHLQGAAALRAFQGYRHYTGDGPNDDRLKGTNPLPFELLDGITLTDQTIAITQDFDTSHLLSLNWKDHLPDADPFALLFVSLEGTPKPGLDTRQAKPIITQAFVQLTDLGLAWKINKSEAFVYVYSCETGRPLPHVKLDVFGEDSKPLHSIRTDADGVARVPRDAEARHLRASWGDDTFLTAFDDEISTVSMWRFPVRHAWDYETTAPRHTFLFTDRSLYRPGETVHLKGLVRTLTGNTFHQEATREAKLTVRDSARRIILEEDITLSKQGSFDQSFPLPAETVGRFQIKLSWPEEQEAASAIESWRERYVAERNASFTHSFRVEEFRRNAFEVESTLSLADQPNQLTLALDANYFQGQPVAHGTVKWFLQANSTGIYPDGYRDFLFGDHRTYDRHYWSHYFGYNDHDYYRSRSSSQNGSVTLDAEGHSGLSFTVPTEKFPSPRQITVTTEVTDARNQTLSHRASLTIQSSDLYLGVSRQDQLIRAGDQVLLKVVAVDSDGKPAPATLRTELSISREYNEQVKLKTNEGRVSVRNETHTEELGTEVLTIQPDDTIAGGLLLPFTPENAGRHTLTFTGTDPGGRAFRTALVLYVYAADQYPWAYENGMKIKLVPEKPNYQPGDTARILVLSPIEGTALITLEREGVQSHFIRELRADNPVIEIPITEAQAPNAFASVLIIKGARDNRREVKEPLLRLGYCELKVANVKEQLTVDLQVPGDYHRPGEEITVTGRITTHSDQPVPHAEVTLYAVDEGTLAVMGYRTPNPMAYFYAPRQLRTKAGTTLGSFVSESTEERHFFNKGFFIGGGGDYEGFAELKLREDFTPCAHWAPALTTGADGRFTTTFPSPDTLTRYRVIAIAHEGATRFGSNTTEFVVNKPLMLEPSVPRFAHEGDILHPKVLVQNSSDHSGTWEISLELDSITTFLEGTDRLQTKTVTLSPHGSATLSFDVHFADTGHTDWTWSARPITLNDETSLDPSLRKELSDAVVSRFEVNYPMPLLRESHFIRFEGPQENRNLLHKFSPQLLQGRGELELQFGKSLLLEAGSAIDYLLHYPYGCVEQTTSSTIPWIAALNLRGLSPELAKRSESEIRGGIQAGANRLLSMQTRSGGLAYWPGGREPEVWASAYGGMGLLLCKEAGAQVPAEAIADLTNYLESILKNLDDNESAWERENLCRACFVLAMAGKPQEPYHNRLLDLVDTLSANARCFLALAIHEAGGEGAQETAENLLALPAPSPTKDTYWMRYRPSAAYQLLAANRITPAQAKPLVDQLLADRNERGHWRTTWCNAWSLYALGDYAARAEDLDTPVTIEILTADGTRHLTLGKDHYSETIKLRLHPELRALVTTNGSAYVRAKLASKPQASASPPVSKGGFQIARTYHRILADGTSEPLQTPTVGDLLKVELEITVPTDNSRYIVIDDALPSLFETVNTDFESQTGALNKDPRSWRISHQELRDDRALFFLNHVWKRGRYKLHYYARVTTAGHAVAPPAKVEAMYDPQSYALSASRTFQTQRD